MTTAPSFWIWFEPLALLGLEVCLLTLLLAVSFRWASSAAWRRTLCQAGLTGVLLITACDLSGSARGLAAWVARSFDGHGQQNSLALGSAGISAGVSRLIRSRSSSEQPNEVRPRHSVRAASDLEQPKEGR